MRRLLALVFFGSLAGCGARTALDTPPPRDGGPSQGDGGLDGGPPDGGMLVVDCGRSTQYTAPRRPLTLTGTATGPDAIVAQGWAMTSSPAASMPIVEPGADPALVTITPDVPGTFLLQYSARDAAGRTATCEVDVESVVGPPIAICPEDALYTSAGAPLVVMGDAFDDEGVVGYQWQILSSPPGSMPSLSATDVPVIEFQASTLGTYVLQLTVFDADMATGTCTVTIQVTAPPMVDCGEGTVRAPTRRPVTLRARATDDVGVASVRWDVIDRPSGSTASPRPPDAETTMFTPDERGNYLLRFTATDIEGQSASCEIMVIGTPTPPDVTCPDVIETTPLTPVDITATAVDDGTIVTWGWNLSMRPLGSAARPPSPPNRATTTFTPDIAGVYEVTVTATDDDGMSDTCTTRVNAGNIDGLRIEMFWDTNGSDIDTHLLSPSGTRWTSDDDCYYANCNVTAGRDLQWGGPGGDDNPRLDIDDVDGFGPENINVASPQPGTYRVGIHDYRSSGPNRVTVRIYCGGSTTEPRQTFGPVVLRDHGGSSVNDFWRVADVNITATGCTITDLSRGGRPWIETYNRTMNMR